MSIRPGTLYVVATPIGNLEDMSLRAIRVLGEVDLVAAEDTRHSGRLLHHFGLERPMLSLHEHNERARTERLLAELAGGRSVALVSDAGTPLVSDPGFDLVRAARAAGLPVTAVPGPSSLLAALSISGLPTDRFVFEGFLPARAAARRRRLDALAAEARTLVLFESPHRIVESLRDMAERLGADREAALARELTKRHEQVRCDRLGALSAWAAGAPECGKGELVVMVAGEDPAPEAADGEVRRILACLLAELPAGRAAGVAARITGRPRNLLYRLALEMADPGLAPDGAGPDT